MTLTTTIRTRKRVRSMTSFKDSREIFLDIETFSNVDIRRAGLYPYIESDDFELLLIAYAWGDEPVRVLDLISTPNENTEQEVLSLDVALRAPGTIKIAHNNAFERTALGKWAGHYMPPEEWGDTMVMLAMNGLPMSLEAGGAALQIPEQKLDTGTVLINYFCKPCKPTIANGVRTRNLPEHAPDKWEKFKEYCQRDVEAMRQIYRRLQSFPVPDWERKVWYLDAHINERGVLVDTELAQSAVSVDNTFKTQHIEELHQMTGLSNPNSVAQLKDWLGSVGVNCESLNKATLDNLKQEVTDPTIHRVLELRQLLGKTSTKKYEAMTAAACKDNRVRGLMQYYGAARTGRWAGRLVQVQNLPQNHLDDIDKVRELVRVQDLESLELLYDSVPDVLSQLIRTAFIAKPGHTFLVSDYSAIEARVIAYLAGEQWRQDIFAQGGDIYCSSASQMFKVPVEKHGVNGHLRQKGKIAELACGYGGGVGALKAFGADKMGLSEEEMQDIVTQWRLASPAIPRFWRNTEKAAKCALNNPGKLCRVHPTGSNNGITYWKDKDAMRCKLPSGRILTYWQARLEDDSIVFMGQNQTTRKWEKTETWGGKLVENIVQAVARDCLAVALLRLDKAGYHTVFTVHDEIIAEEPEDGRTWQDMTEIMGQPIPWAPGLLLRSDGYTTKFYRKD